MSGRLAILCGQGGLPVALAESDSDAVCVAFQGVAHDLTGPVVLHRFERLGEMFADLRARGVTRVVLAGAMSRPALDPAVLDPLMMALAPRLMAAMQGGDDALLRLILSVIEEQGFAVMGAHELRPDLLAAAGHLAGPAPGARDLEDAARAADILMALAPLDVGQGAVVAGGLVLGIETVQGTDAMLEFVGATPAALRRGAGGVFVKASKRGQELRVDMPAIGPDTIARAAAAGLRGIVLEAGRVLILERARTVAACDSAGIFLLARDL